VDENIKKQIISEIGQTYGYEKAVELVDSIEYVDYLNDERINIVIEFFYNVNQKLISDNRTLIEKINMIIPLLDRINKDKIKNSIYISSVVVLCLIFGIIVFLIKN
jgi:hypothetical protein